MIVRAKRRHLLPALPRPTMSLGQRSGVGGVQDARRAWRARCMAGGGAGSGQPAISSERDRPDRFLATRRSYIQKTGPPKVRLCCACGRRTCDEAAGTRHRGSCEAGAGARGGFECNCTCGWEPEASCMTPMERSEAGFVRGRLRISTGGSGGNGVTVSFARVAAERRGGSRARAGGGPAREWSG